LIPCFEVVTHSIGLHPHELVPVPSTADD
jgi:hypothetical protein